MRVGSVSVARDRISVCICTFKRVHELVRLLDALVEQVREPRFEFDVIVVDNDRKRSAQETVRHFGRRVPVSIFYDCEYEQNISLARNRAIHNSTGNLLAFIDDDEYPCRDWLLTLYRTLKESGSHGVLGPVVPDLPEDAPAWLRQGRFLERSRHPTGTVITAGDARTGNVLFLRSIFCDGETWFDPAFGRTGGEDTDFFQRQFNRERLFIWCDEAVVYETVPAERWKASFHIKRLLRAGTLDGEWIRSGRLPGRGVIVKNLVLLCGCAILTLPSFLLPKHIWMRVLQKLAYCGGLLAAVFGLSLLRYRD